MDLFSDNSPMDLNLLLRPIITETTNLYIIIVMGIYKEGETQL